MRRGPGSGYSLRLRPLCTARGRSHPLRRTLLKKTLLFAATTLALSLAAPVAAHDARDCLDESCNTIALFDGGGEAASADATVAAPRFGTWGIDTAGMDTDVAPGEDFFGYVSGIWAENTEIPSDRSSYGSFLCCATCPRRGCASSWRATRWATRPPAATRPRSPRSTTASWTRRRSRHWARSRCSRTWTGS